MPQASAHVFIPPAAPYLTVVITGFNTDVSFNGKTYHVQTEDKGTETPLILTLVYDRGTILAAKRTPYDDLLLNGGLDEKALGARLQRQHKLICAAIMAGRLEDLKKLSAKGAPAVQPEAAGEVAVGIPMPEGPPVWDIPLVEGVDVVEQHADSFPDGPKVMEGEGISVVDEISDLVPSSEERLKIKLFGSQKFISGDRKNINVLVCRGSEDASIAGANVMIKVLGSDFRPIIYHAKADANGIATVIIKIPTFRSGRAALLVRATHGGEEAELRRGVAHEE